MKTLGVDRVINFKEENFEDALHEYDAVLDTIGGAILEKSFAMLKEGGVLVSVSGTPTGRFAEENGLGMLKKILFSLASAKLTKLAIKTQGPVHAPFYQAEWRAAAGAGKTSEI